jgi:ABC-type multidrug transport system fused ATPase/permease subunit
VIKSKLGVVLYLSRFHHIDKSNFMKSINVLNKNEKVRVGAIAVIQIANSLLDLIGVGLIGILGALTISGMQSKEQGPLVSGVLDFLNIDNFSLQAQALALGSLAGLTLISKTILSIVFTRKTLYFLSRCGAKVSSNMIDRILSQSVIKIQARSSQDILYSVTTGVQTITLGIIGQSVILLADISLLVIMGIGLLLVDPLIALSTLLIFGAIGVLLYKLMHQRAAKLGRNSSLLNVASNEKIIEVIHSYRELVVKNRRSYYAKEISNVRHDLANTLAELSFMPNLSKYIVESTVVVGSLIIGGMQFALKDAYQAIATLTIFMAAGSRIAPAVLRVQQGAISIKSNIGASVPTLELIHSLSSTTRIDESIPDFSNQHDGFIARIDISNASFTYPGEINPIVNSVSLSVEPGMVLAVVGPSGAGKSTLVDLILGILDVEEGQIDISGMHPLDAAKKWPGAIAYVPQDVLIANGSIRENIALGYPENAITDELILLALNKCALGEFLGGLPLGLDSIVGERGARLSGGQKQRIGIARAIVTNPKLLVLDEATSAMDGGTELEITEQLEALRETTTIILIAHRLSTVKNADKVIYIDEGRIVAQGKFDEVRRLVPDFDLQAKLMGM